MNFLQGITWWEQFTNPKGRKYEVGTLPQNAPSDGDISDACVGDEGLYDKPIFGIWFLGVGISE